MNGGDQSVQSAVFDTVRQAQAHGQLAQARAAATAVLSHARSSGDLLHQARAFQWLGRIEHLQADLAGALALARQAAHLFHVLDSRQEESAALSHVAHLCTLLGRAEEAVEHATLAVRLAEALPPGPHMVVAYNYLGVASTWVDVDRADTMLCRAIAFAEALGAPQAALRPMTNRLLTELYRLELCRQRAQPTEVKPAIRTLLAHCTEHFATAPAADDSHIQYSPGMVDATLHTARAGLLAHSGEIAAALATAEQVNVAAVSAWMQGFMLCVRARCQLVAGLWTAALDTTRQTLAVSQSQGQTPFVLLTHYQRMEAFEALGDTRRMLVEFRAFRTHQLHHQADTITSHEGVAALRLAWREQTRTLEALHSSSRALERLAREDALTGLANRRALELCLDDLLSRQADPWCLVILDIDEFKQINDRHSHVLGDQVLRQMATLLREVVRVQDLAVRLAGDEFVLILRDTTEARGRQVIDRLVTAIDQYPWTTLQPGLRVRASLGLAQAQPGDTSTSLLLRSDRRMYADKADKLTRPAGGTAPLTPPAPG